MKDNRFSLTLSDPKLIKALGALQSGQKITLSIGAEVKSYKHAKEPDYGMSESARAAMGKKKPEYTTCSLECEVTSLGGSRAAKEKAPDAKEEQAETPKKMSPGAMAAMKY